MNPISKKMLVVASVLVTSNAIAAEGPESGEEKACGARQRQISDAEFFDPYHLSPRHDDPNGFRKQNVCKYLVGGKPGARAHEKNLRALMSKKDHDDCLERMNFARRKGSGDGIESELARLTRDSHRERALKAFGMKLPEATTKGFFKASGEWLIDYGKDEAIHALPFSDLVFGLGATLLHNNCTDAQSQINQAGLPFLLAKGGRFVYQINMRERMAGDSSVVYESLTYEVRVGNETRSIPIWGAILPVHMR